LIALSNWVLWRWETVKDKKGKEKWTKVPYQPNGSNAKNNDREAWCSYEVAIAAYETGKFDGIGFCLLGMAAFDIDHCRDASSGEIDPWAADLVERTGSYSEITVSGTGLRIIGYGEGERLQRKLPVHDGVSLEAYRKTERYIVITGNPLPDTKALINIDKSLDDTVAELEAKKKQDKKAKDRKPKGEQGAEEEEDKLDWTIKTGGDYQDIGKRSDGVWYVIMEMLRRGYICSTIKSVLLNTANKISDHIFDQAQPLEYARKQITKAKKAITLSRDDKDVPYKTQNNIRIALLKLGVTLRYDEFADRTLIKGLPDFGPTLDDAALDRIWLLMEHRFRLSVQKDLMRTVVIDTARLNKFHPVRDYLAQLKWDGVERIDKWLIVYGGAEDNKYTRAVGALLLIAGVRRIRKPGCKFDEMVILEQEVQGTDKSTALSTLAGRDEWFSDDLPLNIEGKQVIEALRGRWIIEAGELSGMRRTDVQHLKAFLSRQVDRARLAYGRITSEVPRQCVIVGTTNDQEYLRDTTGNRRFWPVKCKRFDVEGLKKDRDQLWAEAAHREANGASIRLAQELWGAAGEEQAKRLAEDPWVYALHEAFEHLDGSAKKISMGTVWTILEVKGAQQTQEQSRRVGDAMRKLGWERPNTGGTVKIDGELVSGFVKGERPWKTVTAWRTKEGDLHVMYSG
jgi:predicted P-loop ATPase